MTVDEFVAVVPDPNGDREAFHELDADGEVVCSVGNDEQLEFNTIPRRLVPSELDRCQRCVGDVEWSGGQGSTLAAKLAAVDPDEVSAP